MKNHGPTMVDNRNSFGIGMDCFSRSKTTVLIDISRIAEGCQFSKDSVYIIVPTFWMI